MNKPFLLKSFWLWCFTMTGVSLPKTTLNYFLILLTFTTGNNYMWKLSYVNKRSLCFIGFFFFFRSKAGIPMLLPVSSTRSGWGELDTFTEDCGWQYRWEMTHSGVYFFHSDLHPALFNFSPLLTGWPHQNMGLIFSVLVTLLIENYVNLIVCASMISSLKILFYLLFCITLFFKELISIFYGL